MRAPAASTFALFALSAGCSSFVGGSSLDATDVATPADAPPTDAFSTDATASDAPPADVAMESNATVDASEDHAPPPDVTPYVCGSIDAPCDPFTDRGCGAGLRCIVTSLFPPTFACGVSGPRRLGESCDATTETTACTAGLQCLSGRCLTPCCPGDHSGCLARSPRSACAVITDSVRLLGCTVPGECAYRPADTCPEGSQCYPQSALGEAACRPHGSVALDGRCTAQNECARGLTCLGGAGSFGRCRPVCSPRGSPPCAVGLCRLFADRPTDFGACD